MDLQISCVWGAMARFRRLAPVSGDLKIQVFMRHRVMRELCGRLRRGRLLFLLCFMEIIACLPQSSVFQINAHLPMFSIHFGGARKHGESESGGADGGQLKRILHTNSLLTENH